MKIDGGNSDCSTDQAYRPRDKRYFVRPFASGKQQIIEMIAGAFEY